MTTGKHYYGIEYAYGSDVANGWPASDEGGGVLADIVYRFRTAAERDAWVEDGNPYQGSGERKALNSRCRTARRVLAEEVCLFSKESI